MTREQAIDNAVRILIAGVALQASRSPREAAEAAWYPGHELGSVDAIEAEIVRMRAEDVELIAAMDRDGNTVTPRDRMPSSDSRHLGATVRSSPVTDPGSSEG